MAIQIQQTDEGYLIGVPSSIGLSRIQSLIDRLEFFEALANSQASEEDVRQLSKLVKSNWSPVMKKRLAELDEFEDLFE
ncbi:MAG: hypothetical protein WBA17_06495 [Saprospiraceae bacterium]